MSQLVGLSAARAEVARGRGRDRIVQPCEACGAAQSIEIATDGRGRLVELPEPCTCGAAVPSRCPLRPVVVVAPVESAPRREPPRVDDRSLDAILEARMASDARERLRSALSGMEASAYA
jgi:hypothetical protein